MVDSNNPATTDRSLALYAARLAGDWMQRFGSDRTAELEGTLVKVDISGFTRLSERLSVSAATGAEELNVVLNDVFSNLIAIVHQLGGDILQFGGDALLEWFEGNQHHERAARAAWLQQQSIRQRPAESTPLGPVRLRMSVGAASGTFGFAVVGTSHQELLVLGDAAARTIRMEQLASPGAIYVDDVLAHHVATRSVDDGAHRLRQLPTVLDPLPTPPPRPAGAAFLAPEIAAVEAAGVPAGEHRRTGVAFLELGALDTSMNDGGIQRAAEQLASVAAAIEAARDRYGVQWTATDLAHHAAVFLLYSGAPTRLEHGDERLLRACTDIRDACAHVALRIGVHTGRAFAADIGAPDRRTYAIIGDTTNLAARLMSRASIGQVVASRDVVDRAGQSHDLEWMTPFTVKGRRTPVEAAVLGAARPPRAHGRAHDVPLVGRQVELATLSAALNDRSHTLIHGDAGIGKSRLINELCASAGLVTERSSGIAYLQQQPYGAIAPVLRRMLPNDPRHVAALARDAGHEHYAPLLALPLGVDMEPTSAVEQLETAFVEITRNRLLARILHRVIDRPTLLAVEEVQWLDRASCGLLDELAGVADTNLVVLGAVRSTDTGHGLDVERWSMLELMPLSPTETRRLANAAAGDAALSDTTLEAISREAGGNPLFTIGLALAASRTTDGLLPETTDAVVATSIDQLAPADRALVRHTSVFGNGAPLRRVADVLYDPELIDPERWAPLRSMVAVENERVAFHHDAFRRGAYEGLAVRRRRMLHARLADALAADPDAAPAELGAHLHAAGRFGDAFAVIAEVANSAADDGALLDAATLYERALDCARRMAVTDTASVADVAMRAAETHEIVGNYSIALSSLDVARRAGAAVVPLLTRRATVLERLGEAAAALRLLRRAERSEPSPDELIDITLRTASVQSRLGRLRAAYDTAARALQLAEARNDARRSAEALIRLEMNGSELGLPAAAEHGQRALELVRALGRARDLGHLLLNLGAQSKSTDNWVLAAEQYDESQAAYQRAGDAVGRAFAINNRAEILLDQGRLDEAMDEILEARRIFRAAGHSLGVAATASTIGTIHARRGEHDVARTWLHDAATALHAAGFEILVLDAALRTAENELLAACSDDAHDALERARRLAERLGDTGGLDLGLARLRAVHHAVTGVHADAVTALRDTAAAARTARAALDTVLCLDALHHLGAATADEHTECRAIVASLGIAHLPPFPGTKRSHC